MTPIEFTAWFKREVEPTIKSDVEINYVSDSNTELGEFEGVQIDSSIVGGYIYFWSSGLYSYHLFDFFKDAEVIPVTEGDYNGEPFDRFFAQYLKTLHGVLSHR